MKKRKYLYNDPSLKQFRKDLRNDGTPAEAVMWTMLKNRQVNGLKFRRQYSVGNYILDFYCPQVRLGIELDGADHFTDAGFQYDERRTAYLNKLDIQVLRFENRDVFEAPEAVIDEIKQHLPPLPPPPKEGSK